MITPVVAASGGIGMDVVEVLRGTAAGPLLVAAGALGGAAAGASLVTVAMWLAVGRGAPRAGAGGVRWAAVVALLATVAEAGLLLVDGARPGERWLTVALARLLVLLLFIERRGSRRARDLLVLPLLATALLGAPLASGASAPATVMVTAVTALVVVVAALRAITPPESAGSQRRSMVVAISSLVVVTALLAALSAPDPVPPHHQERLAVDGLTFDVTVAPARPGPNEAHLYAFDADGSPAPVDEVSVAVVGAPTTAHELFQVSPDHHLTYALELPEMPSWRIVFHARGTDGLRRELELDVVP